MDLDLENFFDYFLIDLWVFLQFLKDYFLVFILDCIIDLFSHGQLHLVVTQPNQKSSDQNVVDPNDENEEVSNEAIGWKSFHEHIGRVVPSEKNKDWK